MVYCIWNTPLNQLNDGANLFLKFSEVCANNTLFGFVAFDSAPIRAGMTNLPTPIPNFTQEHKLAIKTIDYALDFNQQTPSELLFSTIRHLLENNASFKIKEQIATELNITALKQIYQSDSNIHISNEDFESYISNVKTYLHLGNNPDLHVLCKALSTQCLVLSTAGSSWSFLNQSVPDYQSLDQTLKSLPLLISKSKDLNFLKRLVRLQSTNLKELETLNNKILNNIISNVVKAIDITLDLSLDIQSFISSINKHPSCHFLKLISLEQIDSRLALHITLSNRGVISLDSLFKSSDFKYASSRNDFWTVYNLLANEMSVFGYSSIPFEHKTVDPSTLLVIDQIGWAFFNIANEICNRSPTVSYITIPELTFLERLQKCHFVGVRVAVAFWYKSSNLVKSMCPKASILTTIYDHYSWKLHPQDFIDALSYTDMLGFGNNQLKLEMLNTFQQQNIIKKPMVVLKDGVSREKFPPHEKPKKDNFVFGWIGKASQATQFDARVIDLKGVSIIEAAFSKIKAQNPHIELFLYNANILPQLSHADVWDKFYSKIDCLICASESEGTPNPVFEALSCGIPIISTHVGNVADVLIEGVNGLFFDRTSEHLAEQMIEVSQTDWDQNVISQSVDHFSWDYKAQVWLHTIKALTLKQNTKLAEDI